MSLFGRLKKLKCNPLKKKGYRLEYHPVPPEADTMAMSRARFFMALVASTTIARTAQNSSAALLQLKVQAIDHINHV
jgi:hypothetical protein